MQLPFKGVLTLRIDRSVVRAFRNRIDDGEVAAQGMKVCMRSRLSKQACVIYCVSNTFMPFEVLMALKV
jgi:hypothetical protein